MNSRKWFGGLGAALAAILVLLMVSFFVGLEKPSSSEAVPSTPNASDSPTPTPTPEQCSDTWVIKELPSKQSRLFFEGIAEIRDATTNEQAAAAAYAVLDKYKTDPNYLVSLAKVAVKKDVDPKVLVATDGCASPAAAQLVLEIGGTLAMSKVVADDVPTDATNSGVNDAGQVVSAEQPGIGGDRKAIKITLPDGSYFWIMARCGNIATPGGTPPSFPPGPTDQCKYNPNLPPDSKDCHPPCPPNTTPWPECNELKWIKPSPVGEGWDQRGTDNGVTDGQQSADQIESGDTRGNAVEDQVPDTGPGTVTPDTLPSNDGGPVAGGGTAGGDDQSEGGVDEGNTNQDEGGTDGDTCVPDPIAGITC
jgi:hypothetical protein